MQPAHHKQRKQNTTKMVSHKMRAESKLVQFPCLPDFSSSPWKQGGKMDSSFDQKAEDDNAATKTSWHRADFN